MDNCYVVFTLNSGKELIATPFNDVTADELTKYVSNRLKEDSYVQIGKYGVPIESLKHYEVREMSSHKFGN